MTPRFNTGEYEDPGHRPAFLYVERGPGAGQLVPIKQGDFTLGRASTAELRLQHPSVSRRHAQITRRGDRFTLKDLGSQNGTFINRKRVTSETEVYAGDEIALGSAIVRLRGTGLPESPHPPPATPAPEDPKARLSPRRLTLLAAVLGTVVAVVLVLTVTRFVKKGASRPTAAAGKVVEQQAQAQGSAAPSAPALPEAAPPVEAAQAEEAPAEAPPPVQEAPALQATAPVEAAPPSEEDAAAEATAESGEAPAEPVAATAPVAAVHPPAPPAPSPAQVARPTPAPGPAPKLRTESPAVPVSAKAVAAKTAPQAPARKKVPDTRPAAGKAQAPHPQAEAEALARYEAGDVDNALAIARRARLEQLVSRLERFRNAWSAGRAALEAHDGPTAVRQFATAQQLDEELAHGWSRYGPRIRAALERAQLMARTQ
jgi:chemotaxis protein histidine kinase CheA